MSATSTCKCITQASTGGDGNLESHDLYLPFKVDSMQVLHAIPLRQDQTETGKYVPTEVVLGTDHRLPKKVVKQLLSSSTEEVEADEVVSYLQSWSLSHVPSTYNGSKLCTKEKDWPLYFSHHNGDAMDLD